MQIERVRYEMFWRERGLMKMFCSQSIKPSLDKKLTLATFLYPSPEAPPTLHYYILHGQEEWRCIITRLVFIVHCR